MTKELNGKELAGFIKERQAREIRSLSRKPRLLIIRDSDNPVIEKYVKLKMKYGEDIGVEVEDFNANSSLRTSGARQREDKRAVPVATGDGDAVRREAIRNKILQSNSDPEVSGIIIQLPLLDKEGTDELCDLIAPKKDVDGLGEKAKFDSATATAIMWLLSGYNIELEGKKIALVGRGKLVGAPLLKMFKASGYNVEMFHRGSDLTKLKDFDIIISATGVPGLISGAMIKAGAVVVDAGTASENGVLKGDVADEVRERTDLLAITPKIGGVGPLTVAALFDHVIHAVD